MGKLGKIFAGTALLALILTGCNVFSFGKASEESIEIEKDDAKELDVELKLGAGELNLSGGANQWLEGRIEDSKEPKVSYKLNGDKGKLTVAQKSKQGINFKDNEWDLQLTKDVPLSLKISTGAAETDLNLSGIQLTDLDIETGVGELNLDVSGDWKESFDINLETGVGQVTVILPSNVGVKVTSSKGIGSAEFKDLISQGNGVYVNEAYENSDIIITVNAEMGVGEVIFKVE
ncbi:hypothetical protein GCM10008967_05020 [Bacillus carboniphilus]|uniref:DUF2154 domain-containing protein n=1 Tax=Bacillus carboniphilus TaxID=86663 RepID=A0ABN0VUC4_9BACI